MKRTSLAIMAIFILLSSVGCWRPYDKPEYIEVDTNETAFLVPMEGNGKDQAQTHSEEFLSQNKVQAKRIQIPHRWNSTGYHWQDGEYMGTMRLIKLNRAPVTREWTAEKGTGTAQKDQAVWVESKDSVGFSTGFTITARIPEETSAKFLYRYDGKSLADVVDGEIRARVQQIAAEVAAKYDLDALRSKKQEMIEAVRADVLPFAIERGFEVTTLGMFGGFHYENPDVQKAIDRTVQDQQAKVSAQAAFEAQLVQNKTIKLAAEAKAEAFSIESLKMGNDVYLALRQFELEKQRLEKWNGQYPQFMLNSNDGNKLNLLVPAPNPK
jgi:hypothetical protein